MLEEPYYFRPESYLYSLQSHPDYYFCVGRSDTAQALWGLVGEEVYIIWFTFSGDMREGELLNRADLLASTDKLDHNIVLDKATLYLQHEFNLEDQKISVKRFWLGDMDIGIEDVTDNIKECLVDSSSFTPDEIVDCEESLEIWKSEGQFAFWWEQNFYVSLDGFVETS